MKKRAITNEQKREIVERLYACWIKNHHERLGQLIWNNHEGRDFFYVEDEDFIEILEKNNG